MHQAAAAFHVLTSERRVEVIVGTAGAGKTIVLAIVCRAKIMPKPMPLKPLVALAGLKTETVLPLSLPAARMTQVMMSRMMSRSNLIEVAMPIHARMKVIRPPPMANTYHGMDTPEWTTCG
jgi:predicted ATPase